MSPYIADLKRDATRMTPTNLLPNQSPTDASTRRAKAPPRAASFSASGCSCVFASGAAGAGAVRRRQGKWPVVTLVAMVRARREHRTKLHRGWVARLRAQQSAQLPCINVASRDDAHDPSASRFT